MANFKLPYYKGHINYEIPDELINGVLVSQTENYVPTNTETGLVKEALEKAQAAQNSVRPVNPDDAKKGE